MIGRTISHFRITRKLGEGGMGVVYLAEDTTLGRTVALKFLPPATASNRDARDRFLNEARAAAALSHPNICTVYEVGESDGDVFIAMALVDGENLNEKMSGDPLPLKEALRLAIGIGEALAVAHEHGVVHRDIKPGNIMVTARGEAIVTDFGLAKISGAAKLTRTGSTTGTPAYMSPEQSRGERVDHRTDIWSLGAVLYEMLTGRRPFRGENPQAVLHSILNDEPEPPTSLRSNVPMDLERIVVKAMAKTPEDRYQHMDDLLVDLRAVQRQLDSQVVTPQAGVAPTLVTRTPQPPRPRRRVAAILASIAVVVAVAIVGVVLSRSGRESAPGRIDRVAVVAFENRSGDASLDPLGEIATARVSEGIARTGVVEVLPVPAADPGALGGLAHLADELEADMLVWGTYHTQEDSIIFQTHLQSFGDEATDIVFSAGGPSLDSQKAVAELRDRAMGGIAMLHDPISSAGVFFHVPSYSAFRAYSEGLRLFGADTRAALQSFRSATELDPAFTMAWVSQLYALTARGRSAETDSLITWLRAEGPALSPREQLDVDLIESAVQGNIAEALRIGRIILKQFPQDYGAKRMMLGLTTMMNRPKETIEVARDLIEQEPDIYLRSNTYGFMINAYHLLGNHEQELRVARQAISEFPDLLWLRAREAQALAALGRVDEIDTLIGEARALPTQRGLVETILQVAGRELIAHGHKDEGQALLGRMAVMLEERIGDDESAAARSQVARALYDAGRYEEAREIFSALLEQSPDDVNTLGYLGVSDARLGDEADARAILTKLVERDVPYEQGQNLYWAACVSAQLGEREQAMTFLRQAHAKGLGMGILTHRDYDLAPLWEYEPFREFLKPKG